MPKTCSFASFCLYCVYCSFEWSSDWSLLVEFGTGRMQVNTALSDTVSHGTPGTVIREVIRGSTQETYRCGVVEKMGLGSGMIMGELKGTMLSSTALAAVFLFEPVVNST